MQPLQRVRHIHSYWILIHQPADKDLQLRSKLQDTGSSNRPSRMPSVTADGVHESLQKRPIVIHEVIDRLADLITAAADDQDNPAFTHYTQQMCAVLSDDEMQALTDIFCDASQQSQISSRLRRRCEATARLLRGTKQSTCSSDSTPGDSDSSSTSSSSRGIDTGQVEVSASSAAADSCQQQNAADNGNANATGSSSSGDKASCNSSGKGASSVVVVADAAAWQQQQQQHAEQDKSVQQEQGQQEQQQQQETQQTAEHQSKQQQQQHHNEEMTEEELRNFTHDLSSEFHSDEHGPECEEEYEDDEQQQQQRRADSFNISVIDSVTGLEVKFLVVPKTQMLRVFTGYFVKAGLSVIDRAFSFNGQELDERK